MRVCLDTNIWVSAFLNPLGAPGRLMPLIESGRLSICATDHLWNELRGVCARPNIRKMLEARDAWEAVQELLRDRLGLDPVPDIPPSENWLPSDPDDNWVIQCALTSHVECIVTGDQALLALRAVRGVRIITARDLLTELRETM